MITLPEVHAVVFDLDGVIVNTEELYRDAVIAAAEAAGRQMQLAAYLSTVGLPDADVRLQLKQWYGDDFDSEALLNGASQRFRALLETELRLKLGARAAAPDRISDSDTDSSSSPRSCKSLMLECPNPRSNTPMGPRTCGKLMEAPSDECFNEFTITFRPRIASSRPATSSILSRRSI